MNGAAHSASKQSSLTAPVHPPKRVTGPPELHHSEGRYPPRQPWLAWRDVWWACSHQAAHTNANATSAIADRLQRWNLPETPVRPVIERLWEAIDQADDWQPFHDWLARTVVQDD